MIRPPSETSTGSVTLRVPDFVDDDGIEYSDIEVIVESDSECGVREAVRLAEALERPLKKGLT